MHGSARVELRPADADTPGTGRLDHHVPRGPGDRAVAVVTGEGGCPVLHRRRSVTGRRAREQPAGRVEPLTRSDAVSGIPATPFHAFRTTGATPVDGPVDPAGASRAEWPGERRVVGLLTAGEAVGGAAPAGLSSCPGPHRLTVGGTGPGGKWSGIGRR
ncbi:hypothetical protein ACIQ9P_28660 [Kitasatospora sp. NPDC094019]|uniref:hypothetical protein n=1 Tax=Kitasatospora sp. NPDC094019 TaxID=3364091 RepID=UPI0037F81A2E